ncbi:RlpA-like double-psi beta-barrel-protein domain-containing protein-containing protein [Lipomyces starkeyi]
MRSFLTFLTLASAALAAPFDKRAVTWVTVTENVDYVQTLTVVQTVVVYATANPTPAISSTDSVVSTSVSSVAPTPTVVYQQDIVSSSILSDSSTSTTVLSVSTSTTSTPAATTSTSSTIPPTPTPSSTFVESTTSSSYVEPQPTTSTSIEPTTSTSSVYVEPTTSVYVQPTTTETPTSTYVEPTTSSTAAPSSSISVITSTHSTGTGTYSGDGTFYATGLGSCGITSADSDYIVAVSHVLMDADSTGNPNTNPLCGKTITAYRDTSSVTVTVVDTCAACAEYDLDFSPSAFDQLGQESEGRIPITWSWD